MKKFLFLLLTVVLFGAASIDARTTKKKNSSSSAKPALVIYCDVDEAPANGKIVEKVVFYPKSSKRVGVKYKGGTEKSYRVDWIDDQYGDAACYYLYNGGFIGYDLDGEYVVVNVDGGEGDYFAIDFDKTSLPNR